MVQEQLCQCGQIALLKTVHNSMQLLLHRLIVHILHGMEQLIGQPGILLTGQIIQ